MCVYGHLLEKKKNEKETGRVGRDFFNLLHVELYHNYLAPYFTLKITKSVRLPFELSKRTDRMANSVDPHQSPLGAV